MYRNKKDKSLKRCREGVPNSTQTREDLKVKVKLWYHILLIMQVRKI